MSTGPFFGIHLRLYMPVKTSLNRCWNAGFCDGVAGEIGDAEGDCELLSSLGVGYNALGNCNCLTSYIYRLNLVRTETVLRMIVQEATGYTGGFSVMFRAIWSCA